MPWPYSTSSIAFTPILTRSSSSPARASQAAVGRPEPCGALRDDIYCAGGPAPQGGATFVLDKQE